MAMVREILTGVGTPRSTCTVQKNELEQLRGIYFLKDNNDEYLEQSVTMDESANVYMGGEACQVAKK